MPKERRREKVVMIGRLKTIAIIALAITAIILNFRLIKKEKEVEKLGMEKGELAENVKSQVIIEKDRIVYRERTEIGEVKGKRIDVCSEWRTEIITDLKGKATIKIKKKGYSLSPCVLGIVMIEGLKVGVGARVCYFGKYGLGVGLKIDLRPYVCIDRRISDIVPFMRNTSLGIVYDGKVGISFSVYIGETMKQEIEMVIKRIAIKEEYTIAKLGYVGYDEHNVEIEKEGLLCDTLEPRKEDMIMEGKYKVIIKESYKFKRELPLLLDVPERIAIRIHRGNSAKDTQGCILVGLNDKAGWLSKSGEYEKKIVGLIKQYKERFITIKKG
jgi:hypothetical protein